MFSTRVLFGWDEVRVCAEVCMQVHVRVHLLHQGALRAGRGVCVSEVCVQVRVRADVLLKVTVSTRV